jgi:OOP family OmpA-OmpF porin
MKTSLFRIPIVALVLVSAGCAHPSRSANRAPTPAVAGRHELNPDPFFWNLPDRDWDSVPDSQDRCRDTAGPASNGGCPAVGPGDADGDGIPDGEDQCPHEAGPTSNHGCAMKDRDHDGIKDDVDECPDEPGPASTMGCRDDDRDGLADKDDICPGKQGPAENHGCPVYKGVTVTKQKLAIAEKIYFADNQSTILAKSFPLLDEVAKVLNENGNFQIRIEVHTDSSDNAQHDLALSEARAHAVRDYLLKKDISGTFAGRLTAKGFGSTFPMAENRTAEERDKNRCVDFVITSR